MFPSRRITMGGDVFRDEYSLAFDGTNDYVSTGANASLYPNDADWAISFWFKSSTTDEEEWIVSGGDETDKGVFQFKLKGEASGEIRCFLKDHDNTQELAFNTAVTGLNDGAWHHFVYALDWSAKKGYAYVDGAYTSSATNTNVVSLANDDDGIHIGKRYNASSKYFTGSVSEMAIYNRFLSASEVAQIYNGKEPFNHMDSSFKSNLKAWWRMGDGVLDSKHLNETDTQVISDMVTPTLGANLWDADASVFTSGTYNWSAYGNNTIANVIETEGGGALKVTYVDTANGAAIDLKNGHDLSSDLTVGKVYKIKFDTKVNTGEVGFHVAAQGGSDDLTWAVSNTSFQTIEGYFICNHATNCYFRVRDMGSGEIAWIDNLSIQEVGGNAGVMQNMLANDFEGDTP